MYLHNLLLGFSYSLPVPLLASSKYLYLLVLKKKNLDSVFLLSYYFIPSLQSQSLEIISTPGVFKLGDRYPWKCAKL